MIMAEVYIYTFEDGTDLNVLYQPLSRGDAMELIKLHGKIDSRIQTQTDSDRVIKKIYGLLKDNRHEVYRQDGVSYDVITVQDIEKALEV